MNNDDITFVDWMPKEFDVWLKGLSKNENFEHLADEIIEFIEELKDDSICTRLENTHCHKCKKAGVRVKMEDIFNGEEIFLCEDCADKIRFLSN